MKRFQSITSCVFLALVISACGSLTNLRSNPFEQRNPVTRCGGKVPVNDPDPTVSLGQYNNPSKGIWLLTPYLELKPPQVIKTEEDHQYMVKINESITKRIQNKFLQEKWVEGVIGFDMANAPETAKKAVLDAMVSNIFEKDTVDYSNWDVPDDLIVPEVPGYSLFLFIDGMVGFDGVTENQNVLYMFIIDNVSKKTTYADFMRYKCDVRNTNGMYKLLDYAYKKVLALRFPDVFAANDN